MPRSRHKGRKKNNLERAARKGKKLYDVRRKRYYDPGSQPQPRNPTKGLELAKENENHS